MSTRERGLQMPPDGENHGEASGDVARAKAIQKLSTGKAMRKRPGHQTDERHAKRPHPAYTADNAIHRSLVEAIYSIGMRHASPAILLEQLPEVPAALTSERVKSHLQKHRNNKERSTDEFMADYDSWLQKACTLGGEGRGTGFLTSPRSMLDMMGQSKVQGGEMAAYLTYSILHEPFEGMVADSAAAEDDRTMPHLSLSSLRAKAAEYTMNYSGNRIPFPILTEEERKSSLGSAFGHVMGTLYTLNRHFMQERLSRVDKEDLSTANWSTFSPPHHAFNDWQQKMQQSVSEGNQLPIAHGEGGFPQFHPVEDRESQPDNDSNSGDRSDSLVAVFLDEL